MGVVRIGGSPWMKRLTTGSDAAASSDSTSATVPSCP